MKKILIALLSIIAIGEGVYILIDNDIINFGKQEIQETDPNNNINSEENKQEVTQDPKLSEVEVREIYKKYIYDENNYLDKVSLHYDLKVNDSDAKEYMIRQAVYNLLEQKDEDIPSIGCDYDDNGLVSPQSMELEPPLKLDAKEVETEIKKMFNKEIEISSIGLISHLAHDIQFRDGKIEVFSCRNNMSGEVNIEEYSKITNFVQQEEKLFVYDEFIKRIYGKDGSILLFNTSGKYDDYYNCHPDDGCPQQMINCGYYLDGLKKLYSYVSENKSELIGGYKHTFENVDGTYYWISTEKTN